MLPPVDDQVLRDNPEFARLYAKLTNVVLNPDGTTRHDQAEKKRAAVRKELDEHRLSAAKHRLLAHAIATASPPDFKPPVAKSISQPGQRRREVAAAADVPQPLLDLLLILPQLLEAEDALPAESVDLLLSSPPLSELGSMMPDLAALVASNLHSSALSLARLTRPTTNASYLHRHIASLSQDHAALLAGLDKARQDLAVARARSLATLVELLHTYTQCLSHLVRCLEAKHGVVARSLELRATDAALQAQRVDADSQAALRSLTKDMYSPEAVAALRNYAAHLQDAKLRATDRLRSLQAELGEYGVGTTGGEGREKTMREMGRVHCEMTRQIEEVKRDLERLQDS
ncbi:PAK-box/P21-Rho-binding protein [Purpureocillium lavendulum]|uniref:PAK-box/P21-Rho-binding protein n=1 Tax=Purpureocillium lavendulum TaxID=1247861 RepID=A0AB34FUH7_9HYPO|nr:PAK-box/P21-Rho-binding protein [Purpureocillium lavendulum]